VNERVGVIESPVGPRVRIGGREVDYFCGTSYFGLHGHPEVIAAACAAAQRYGVGAATALRTPAHVELEERLCRFLDVETVAHIASGYLAPLVLLQALAHDYDVAFADSASHYGVLDALRATGKDIVPFRHLDPDDLARQLLAHAHRSARPLVITDGVFPSTGAIAPLADYSVVLDRYPGSLLCIDDAHALGVIGADGRGSFEYHGIHRDGAYSCGTLSKAFGGAGGIVPGDRTLGEKIRKLSRIPLGASASSVPAAAASAAGVRLLALHPEMRRALWGNVGRLRDSLRGLGFGLPASPVPIISLSGRSGLDLRRVHAALAGDGIAVLHVPPCGYSDAPDVESLRIAVFSTHSQEQIDRLADSIRRAL
jgi:8-amino-7-oxononanoate synthase